MSKPFCNTCNICIGMCNFVHRSPSLVSFRHSNDERNPPDVTGTPAPVEAPGGRQRLDQNLDVQLVEGVLYESRYQNNHLSRKDIAQARTLYRTLLGVEPYADEAYYVGFRVGDQEIGLDPHGHNQGMTGPVGYFHVSDIHQSLQALLGAHTQQEVTDVGGGKLIA